MTGEKPPKWFVGVRQDDCVRLDVRPILATGVDPLQQILARVALLSVEHILLIESPFDPVPLRRLLANRGYDSYGRQISERHWQVYFVIQDSKNLPDLPDLPSFPMERQAGILAMDLRQLEPPNPMIAILKVIESGTEDNHFTVRLLRDPVYLHPELTEQGWQAVTMAEEDGGLTVRISKGHKL